MRKNLSSSGKYAIGWDVLSRDKLIDRMMHLKVKM
jgi:hypothetical protein